MAEKSKTALESFEEQLRVDILDCLENPKVDMIQKISILWRPELAHIQELNGMHRYTDKSKRFVTDRILATVPENILTKQICEELF